MKIPDEEKTARLRASHAVMLIAELVEHYSNDPVIEGNTDWKNLAFKAQDILEVLSDLIRNGATDGDTAE